MMMRKNLLSRWVPMTGGQRTRKLLHVKVRPLKLEGINKYGDEYEKKRMVVVEMKWEGAAAGHHKLNVPFYRNKCQKNCSSHKYLKKGEDFIEWDEEFEKICSFSMDDNCTGTKKKEKKKNCFSSWHVSFKILYGEDSKAKTTKLVEMGKASLNIAELASSSMIHSEMEKKLPVSLQIDGVAIQATLSICMRFAEVRNSVDSSEVAHNSSLSDYQQPIAQIFFSNHGPVSSCNSTGSTPCSLVDFLGNETLPQSKNHSSEIQCNSDPNVKLWKKKWWSFSKRKTEQLIEEADVDTEVVEIALPNSQNSSSWEVKELVSRDGHTKLKANVFFASFDQRSEKAAGEGACAALATVIAHWLQLNQDFMPTTSQFDTLIAEGSSEWRKLCTNVAYMNSFPDNHFDLETVLNAELRPVYISPNKSFTGMFSPEKFENLKGAKSFDDIWEEISGTNDDYDPRIYIVSWNDHFFVLKVDGNAYYIIDSLGERLFEGCNQAYILKFDESTLMYRNVSEGEAKSEELTASKAEEVKDEEESEAKDIICKGKVCCKEFIKRFLAAISISELEEQQEKGSVSTFSLLQRLQIDFHYCSSSSSTSSAASPTYSVFSSEG